MTAQLSIMTTVVIEGGTSPVINQQTTHDSEDVDLNDYFQEFSEIQSEADTNSAENEVDSPDGRCLVSTQFIFARKLKFKQFVKLGPGICNSYFSRNTVSSLGLAWEGCFCGFLPVMNERQTSKFLTSKRRRDHYVIRCL